MTGTQTHRILASLFVAALLLSSVAYGVEQRRPGIAEFHLTPRTDAGDWYGTWAYKSRNQRILLWLQEDESGKPEFRLQYQDLGSTEAFGTDWTGRADYTVVGNDALFHMATDKWDANTITGTLKWDLHVKSLDRQRAGKFEMYRGDDGRILVLHFFDQLLTIQRGEKKAVDETPIAWTFVKISKREIRWEEIF